MNLSEILECEIELNNICNLKCKLCQRQYEFAQRFLSDGILNVRQWIEILDKCKSLKFATIAGAMSEPTLYSELFDLLDYLNCRHIQFVLNTNGNTHDANYWMELGKHFKQDDRAVFTICGHNQQQHEYYRVGSDLRLMLKNVMSFKKTNLFKNDWLQLIRFEYNKHDIDNTLAYKSLFSHWMMIDSQPYNERYHMLDSSLGICQEYNKSVTYLDIQNSSQSIVNGSKRHIHMNCKSYDDKFIWFDSCGKPYPCYLYKLMSNDEFNIEDYSSILNGKYSFCWECEDCALSQLNAIGIERIC